MAGEGLAISKFISVFVITFEVLWCSDPELAEHIISLIIKEVCSGA